MGLHGPTTAKMKYYAAHISVHRSLLPLSLLLLRLLRLLCSAAVSCLPLPLQRPGQLPKLLQC